ncbi:hypothetical protein CTI12_AA548570 [Artemisia annua]|uniref:Zinc finger, CCHC-type n=1 Tax=Artemisia annua TaxID=35608 RepID=A0A2U1KZ27_ARTAN|nr:hypothetical protein CTI12_AA548570 [Artemisia annua]
MCVCSATVAGKSSDDSHNYYWKYTPGMFIHLFLYIDGMVFSCECKAEIWVTKGLLDKAKGNILGMEIIRNQSGNTLRGSQSRVHNGKLVQTLLEGHSILSLEGSLSGDCDVEKNGKWSYIYAVGSQEYQMVCTRPDIASVDVGMLDRFPVWLSRLTTIQKAASSTSKGSWIFKLSKKVQATVAGKSSDDSHSYYWKYTPDGMVFSCECKAEIWVTKGLLDKAKGNILGMEIIRNQSGNTLRGSQSRVHNGKLVQTLLEGHSILSLEGSLSGDCDVEKNGKWSYIYAVGSQEYQMVCTRPDIASVDVGK